VRIVSIGDTSFTEEARHNDILRKRALSSTMAPKARITVSVVLYQASWNVGQKYKYTSHRFQLQAALPPLSSRDKPEIVGLGNDMGNLQESVHTAKDRLKFAQNVSCELQSDVYSLEARRCYNATKYSRG